MGETSHRFQGKGAVEKKKIEKEANIVSAAIFFNKTHFGVKLRDFRNLQTISSFILFAAIGYLISFDPFSESFQSLPYS